MKEIYNQIYLYFICFLKFECGFFFKCSALLGHYGRKMQWRPVGGGGHAGTLLTDLSKAFACINRKNFCIWFR